VLVPEDALAIVYNEPLEEIGAAFSAFEDYTADAVKDIVINATEL